MVCLLLIHALRPPSRLAVVKRKTLLKNQEIIREELAILKKEFPNLITKKQTENKTLLIKDISKWKYNNSILIPLHKKYKELEIYKLSRQDTSKSSYTFTKFITQEFKERYTASFLVKKTSKSDLFAIRIQEEYPNRVDAVFNLSKGIVEGIQKIGAATQEKATIKKLENGWFLCTLKIVPKNNTFKVIIGSANESHQVLNWESKSAINNEIFIALKPE